MSYDGLDAETYKVLYKRYLQKPVDDLLLAGGDVKGKDIIDICAGTMRLSERAMELQCNKIWVIERCSSMIPRKYYNVADDDGKLKLSYIPVENIEYENLNVKYDMAFCQQAINYWFGLHSLESIALRLKPGGKFIFNTFNKRPSKKPTTKIYTINGLHYCEAYQLVGEDVYHTQMCDKIPPHFTSFRWIPKSTYHDVLSKVFDKFGTITNGKTTIYVCEKNNA